MLVVKFILLFVVTEMRLFELIGFSRYKKRSNSNLSRHTDPVTFIRRSVENLLKY